MAKADSVTHTFEPIFNNESKVLILGTFPSVKSREQQFYYGHPQNRFWKLLALLMENGQMKCKIVKCILIQTTPVRNECIVTMLP